jgi:hypothetical protein
MVRGKRDHGMLNPHGEGAMLSVHPIQFINPHTEGLARGVVHDRQSSQRASSRRVLRRARRNRACEVFADLRP